VNELLLQDMAGLRHMITIGLSLRAEAKIKVRQPLQSVTLDSGLDNRFTDEMLEILKEELNVKEVLFADDGFDPGKTIQENVEELSGLPNFYRVKGLDTVITPGLKKEGLMREVIRQVQSARKTADLQVDDRINLSLSAVEAPELEAAIKEHSDTIKAETLAVGLHTSPESYKHKQDAKVEGQLLQIALEKA